MGIHHITAIAGDPQRNLEFYAGTLGLRLVKLTVNFDDPASYHFYYGDEVGHPGSILTFFPWPGGRRGRQGTGQAATVALAIPPASLGFWIEHLLAQGIKYEGPTRRFDEQVLAMGSPWRIWKPANGGWRPLQQLASRWFGLSSLTQPFGLSHW